MNFILQDTHHAQSFLLFRSRNSVGDIPVILHKNLPKIAHGT